MKMNEAIRYFRLQNHLTQEQVASRLGVTAPAVNKWEKGTSCPDITLLPAPAEWAAFLPGCWVRTATHCSAFKRSFPIVKLLCL